MNADLSSEPSVPADVAIRQPMPLHMLTRDEDARATVTCSAPVGSICRLVCAERCGAESWPCGRYDDDPAEAAHLMRDDGECHVVLFLADDPDGCGDEGAAEYVGLIEVEWQGDYYAWNAAPENAAWIGKP